MVSSEKFISAPRPQTNRGVGAPSPLSRNGNALLSWAGCAMPPKPRNRPKRLPDAYREIFQLVAELQPTTPMMHYPIDYISVSRWWV